MLSTAKRTDGPVSHELTTTTNNKQNIQKLHQLLNFNPLNDTERIQYDDDAVLNLIRRSNPEIVAQKYKFNGWFTTIYPLLQAVSLGASQETIKIMHDAHPPSIYEKTNGLTVLHCATKFNAPYEVILYLVDVYPNAMMETNNRGCTPLHMACYYRRASLQVLTLLAHRCPQSTEIGDVDGETPLSLYLGESSSSSSSDQGEGKALVGGLDVVSRLLPMRSSGRCQSMTTLQRKNRWGQTPLHVACSSAGAISLNVIWYLVERYPHALEERDGKGKTPIDLAMRQEQGSSSTSCKEEIGILLQTLHTLLCLHPTDGEVIKLLLESSTSSSLSGGGGGDQVTSSSLWQSRTIPILECRTGIIPQLELNVELMPTLLGQVVLCGRVQTVFGIVREWMGMNNIF